jgi:acyl-CoA thioester hydrolase
MTDGMAATDLTDRSIYRFWTGEHVRFNDLDALGHVNNNVFGVYFESARVGFMFRIGLRNPPVDPAVVIARLEIDFRAELRYPADIEIGLSVLKIGNSSFTLGLGIFREGVCHATCRSYMVRLDMATRRSMPLPPHEREMLEGYLVT